MLASETTNLPLVWIIVLHWQGNEATRSCLKALSRLTYPNFKVLLLDNGSPDDSGKTIAPEFPQIEFLHSDKNLGFAGGANFGLKHCFAKKTGNNESVNWVWLLNNDTVPSPNSLDIIMQEALSNKEAGILGGGKNIGTIDFVKAKTFEKPLPADNQSLSISADWISGNNLLFRKEAFEQVAGFDESYFLYFEDVDICCRLRQAGWKCLLVPKAKIDHIGSASTQGDLSIWRSYYHTRNRLLFFSKHLSGIKYLLALFSIHAHLLRHLFVLSFRGRKGKRQLKAELLGLSDFHKRNYGKANCLDW